MLDDAHHANPSLRQIAESHAALARRTHPKEAEYCRAAPFY
jgi:hypothetical protein